MAAAGVGVDERGRIRLVLREGTQLIVNEQASEFPGPRHREAAELGGYREVTEHNGQRLVLAPVVSGPWCAWEVTSAEPA